MASHKLSIPVSVAGFALLGSCILVVWFFVLSGPARVLIDSGSRVITGILTILGTLLGSYLVYRRRTTLDSRLILILLFANLVWMLLVSVWTGTPVWAFLAGSMILLFLPASLSLFAALAPVGARKGWTQLVGLVLLVNFVVVAMQLITGQSVDRGTGLLGNERASNTIGLFLMLTSLGLWLRTGGLFTLSFFAFMSAAIVSWLGDAKTSLALVLIFLVAFAAALGITAFRQPVSIQQLGKILVALLMTGSAVALSFGGVFTASSANLGPEIREGVSTPYLESLKITNDPGGQESTEFEWQEFRGEGFGTGGSYLGHLLVQGHLDALPDSAALAQRSAKIAQSRSMETASTGLLYSQYRTALGLLDEIGLLGALLFFSLTIASILQFRKCVSGAGLVGVISLVVAAASLTKFLEYPEVVLSMAVFLVLLCNPSKVATCAVPATS